MQNSRKIRQILPKIASNSLKLSEIRLKIVWNPLENCVKFF